MEGIYLLIFFLLYFGIIFILRSYVAWKNTGINPVVFDRSDDAHGFNGTLFGLIALLELVIIILYTCFESTHIYLLPFWYLESEIIRWFGWVMLHGSLIWVSVAQYQMADSWRIGIDRAHPTDLVTTGVFAISRNPIFLGILIADLGLFLVLPNAFTLLVTAISFVVIQTQVRLEEAYLQSSLGHDYQNYTLRVRRWL